MDIFNTLIFGVPLWRLLFCAAGIVMLVLSVELILAFAKLFSKYN